MASRSESVDEYEEAELTKVLQTDLQTIIDELRETNHPVETRRALYEPYATLMQAGYELTGLKIKWIPPREEPSSEEMGKSVANLKEAIASARLRSRADTPGIKAFRDAMVDLLDKLEQACTLNFAFTEEDIQKQYGRWVQSIGIRDDVDPDDVQGDGREIFAGPRARIELEQEPRAARNLDNYDVPLFLGTGVRKGKDATVPKPTLYRHTAVLGVTGYGKSTLLTNTQKQIIESGQGLCFIDPKGDDSERLMEIIPEERADDVIWIEPGSTTGKISGFNFINVGMDPDHPQIETAVAALVSDLKKMLGAGDYWGPRMDRIAGNLIRAMNVFNRNHPERPDLNLADLYYVLQDPRSRREFSVLVQADGIDFVEDYTEKIAEMGDEKLEPILGRMQPWIESPVARRMICFRDNEINIPQAVNNGKIIVVRMGGQPKELKRMLGMAVVRRIWATIRSRADIASHDRTPFYLFVDEAHNIALADDTFPTMLAESRSYRLSINLATQYLSQLPDNVVRAVRVNCDTIMSFNAGSLEEARKVSPQLDLDPQALLNEARFHIWMRIADPDGGEVSDPYKVYIHPPFPPYRTAEEADEIIATALDRCGREKITPKERKGRLQFYQGDGELETGAGQRILLAEEDGEMPPEAVEAIKEDAIEERRRLLSGMEKDPDAKGDGEIKEKDSSELDAEDRQILESIFAARVKAGCRPGEPVEVEKVTREIEDRMGEIGYGSDIANAAEALVQFVEFTRIEGEESLRLTQKGEAEVFTSTGESITGGLFGHRRILRESFKLFTRLGYHTTLPTQEGAELPDGIAESPFDPGDIDTDNSPLELKRELNRRLETLKEKYPHVAELSEGQPIRIEAETSTHLRPEHTLQNLRKSVNAGEKTAFVTKDGYFDDEVPQYVENETTHWGIYIERLLYDQTKETRGGRKVSVPKYDDEVIAARKRDGETLHFYNKDGDYEVTVEGNEYKALRPASDGKRTKWRETADGTVLAEGPRTYEQRDGGENVFAVFDSQQQVAERNPKDVPAYYYYDRAEDEFTVVPNDSQKEIYESREEMEERWETFNPPFLPEVEFDQEPTADDFIVIVIPDADNPEYKEPILIEDGEITPLYETLGLDVPDHAYITEDSERGQATSEGSEETTEGTDSEAETVDEDSKPEDTEQRTATDDNDGDQRETEEPADSSDSPQQSQSDYPAGDEYLFPNVETRSDLPECCPRCGSHNRQLQEGHPYAGPAPSIQNFPAVAELLSEQEVLETTDPPTVTEPIDSTILTCSDCKLVVTLYLMASETARTSDRQKENTDPQRDRDGKDEMENQKNQFWE